MSDRNQEKSSAIEKNGEGASQSQLSAADLDFTKAFGTHMSNKDLDPQGFQSSLDSMRQMINSPDRSEADKLSLIREAIMSTESSKAKVSFDVFKDENGKLVDFDVITPGGRHDLLDTEAGKPMDSMQKLIDSVSQVAWLSMDQVLAENPQKSAEIYDAKLSTFMGNDQRMAQLLAQDPEVSKRFQENLAELIGSLPDELKGAAREFSEVVKGARPQSLPPNFGKLVQDIRASGVTPESHEGNARSMRYAGSLIYALTPAQKIASVEAAKKIEQNPTEEKQIYDQFLKQAFGN